MCSSRPAPPTPPVQKTFVPMPEMKKEIIPAAPIKKQDMEANLLKQARPQSPRKKLTRGEMGTQALRIGGY